MNDHNLADGLNRIAKAITPPATAGTDKTGGHVESLTEAVMGLTAGACRIAEAIESLAAAVWRKHKKQFEQEDQEELDAFLAAAEAESKRLRDEIARENKSQ